MGRHSIGVVDGFELTRGAEADHAVDGTHYDYAVLQVQGLLHLNALIQPRSQIGGRPRAIDVDEAVREACGATASPPPPHRAAA